MTRRGVPLRWSVALWVAGATAVLGVAALSTAYLVVRGALRSDLQAELREDADRVARVYEGEEGDVALAGPTGRVVVQLYDPRGRLVASSDASFETPGAALPSEVLEGQDAWRGRLLGRSFQAALAPFRLGTVAVLADTAYIGRSVSGVARALGLAGLALVVLAVPIGVLVAGAATRPIRRLADEAARLGPERLEAVEVPPHGDEVTRLATVLNDLVARLRASRDAQRAFLAETSHELRTPLTSLRGFLDRAHRTADGASRRDLEDAGRIATGMARLVEDLLELSRGQLVREVDPHLVDLHDDVTVPVAEEFTGVHVEGGPGAGALGDPERLRQALRNLVANAVRATRGESPVEVRTWVRGDEVGIDVHDAGPGVPDEMQARLFEKFAKGPGGGSGLGLAIARQIADLHGGRLTVRSRPGDTVFVLSLPAIEEDEEA